jgi:hypothetical protein
MNKGRWIERATFGGLRLDEVQLIRARRMWNEDHFNTAQIAQRLGLHEADVYNSLRWITRA